MLMGAQDTKKLMLTKISIRFVFFLLTNFRVLLMVVRLPEVLPDTAQQIMV